MNYSMKASNNGLLLTRGPQRATSSRGQTYRPAAPVHSPHRRPGPGIHGRPGFWPGPGGIHGGVGTHAGRGAP